MVFKEAPEEPQGEVDGRRSIIGSSTVSFSFSGERCSFCREAARYSSQRAPNVAPVTAASFRSEHAHAFDVWEGTPCSLTDDHVRVVSKREGRLVCDEGAWSPFRRAALGAFVRRTHNRVEEATVLDFYDMEAELEVFIAGSERPAIRRSSEELPGLTNHKGREGETAYRVFAWDDTMRLMLKADTADREDAWDHNSVTFSLGFGTVGRRDGPEHTTSTLEKEETWFRKSTLIPTLRFLEQLAG